MPIVHLWFIFLRWKRKPPYPRCRGNVWRAVSAVPCVSLILSTVEELVPTPGLRVDVMALGPKGEIWIIECKSSRADYMTDQKWRGYLEWCDRFFWAVDGDFPVQVLPEASGVIIADAYDAAILRMAPDTPLAAARRKVMLQKFARHAALRLQGLRDPNFSAFSLA